MLHRKMKTCIDLLAGSGRGICVLGLIFAFFFISCGKESRQVEGYRKTGELALDYATQFDVDYYEGGYTHIRIGDGSDYVLIPEGAEDSNLGMEGAVLIHEPCENIYLAASSAMNLFLQLDSLDVIKACSTSSEYYAMEEVSARIEAGDIRYVGRYNAPDYEALLSLGTDLAIESTMIYHAPKIGEQLTALGIPVLVERSSYEEEPLGRLEWIKLYGVILGREDEAFEYFEQAVRQVEAVEKKLKELNEGEDKKQVVFFYVSANGYINVRKPRDYISKMISMAGGGYAFDEILPGEDNALTTININWEDFYKEAVNADILIYNGNTDGGIRTVEDLISKNALFKDFKAVKEGQVWCTNLNMFQESGKIADVVEDFYTVIHGGEDTLKYLTKVE